MGISAKTFQRWQKKENLHDGRLEPKHRPRHALTELEKQRMIHLANQDDYAHLPACQIVPKLADTGVYTRVLSRCGISA